MASAGSHSSVRLDTCGSTRHGCRGYRQPGSTIEIIATDHDVNFDDVIGIASIQYSDLQRGPEFEVPLRLGGATTGTVRVRIEPVR